MNVKKIITGTGFIVAAFAFAAGVAFAAPAPQACIGQGISSYTSVAKDNTLGKFVADFVHTFGGQNLNDAARADLCP